MKRIKDFFKRLDDEMAAYAFAEAGELEMAKQILAESDHMAEKEPVDDNDYDDDSFGVVVPLKHNVR